MLDRIRRLPRSTIEAEIMATTKYWYLGNGVGMCHILGGKPIFVPTTDWHLTPHLLRCGFWEIWITQAMARLLKPGMTAVDVGANVGYYTLLMADAVGESGVVRALEPHPNLARLLQASIGVNGYAQRATIHECAAFSVTGETVDFFLSVSAPMNGSIVIDRNADVLSVSTMRLDDLLPPKVDFIKIDIEGAEWEAWRGLQETIARNPDIRIFMEFNSARYDGKKFLGEIRASGMRLGYVDFDGQTKSCDESFVMARTDDVMLFLERANSPAIAA